jgi:hypothetical protein
MCSALVRRGAVVIIDTTTIRKGCRSKKECASAITDIAAVRKGMLL